MGLKLTIGRRKDDAPPLVETLEEEPPAPVETTQMMAKPAPTPPAEDMSTDDPENRYSGKVDPEVSRWFRKRGAVDKRLWVAASLYDQELRRKDAVIRAQPDPFPGEPIMFAASVIRMGERLQLVMGEQRFKLQKEFRSWVIERYALTGVR